jgi:hypothetical protein
LPFVNELTLHDVRLRSPGFLPSRAFRWSEASPVVFEMLKASWIVASLDGAP